MTQYPATRPAAAPGGIDLTTLWITAVSSAAAAYACSQLWATGTLAAAAFTPVLVAILREGLAKSTDVVARAVPVRGAVRSTRPGAARLPDGTEALPIAEPALKDDDPTARVAQPGEISYHGTNSRARHWRVAIITGLLGFLIAAVVFTVPELLAGESASGGGQGTTLFGGQQRESRTPAETTTTSTAPAKTVTTPREEETPTVQPQTVTTPPPTVTTPADPEATTAPAPTEPTEPPAVPLPPVEVP